MRKFTVSEIYVEKIWDMEDLLLQIKKFAESNFIASGIVSGIGSLRCLNIGYFEHSSKTFMEEKINKNLEIVDFQGNISTRNGEIFLHCHIAAADENCNVKGGHLLPGTIVHAAEVTIIKLDGEPLQRVYDPEFGMFILDI